MPGLFRRGRAANNDDDVAISGDIGGVCNSSRCVGNRRVAHYVGLWSGVLEFRCKGCGTVSQIQPGDPVLRPGAPFYPDDAALHRAVKPQKNDEDAEHTTRGDTYADFNRNTKNRRKWGL